eukprot:XP_019077815.1 PREDICTED: uncharacterized protein LOC109123220 [Vitis vinifera]
MSDHDFGSQNMLSHDVFSLFLFAGNRDQLYYTENLHSTGVEYSQIKSTYSLELCFSLPSTGPYPCELKDLSKLTKKKVVSAIDFVNLEANGLPTLSHLNPR